MKKFLCLFLAMLLVVGLFGCGGGNNVRGEVSGNNEPQFSLGNAANNTYKNDFLGLNCTLPATWIFASDEEILEMNNITSEIVGEDVAKQLENATIIYDMYAADEETGNNININMEKLNIVQSALVDIKQVLEGQFDTIFDAYTNMGYTDIAIQYQKVTVDGKEMDSMKITAKIYGIDFYCTTFTFKKGVYLANVTISTLVTDESQTILDCFTWK